MDTSRKEDALMSNEEKILEILSGMKVQMNRMEARMDWMEADLQRVRLYLELDVEKRFDVINEGIDVIQENLLPEERMEKAENDIVVLKTAVKALAREVAELKKAE